MPTNDVKAAQLGMPIGTASNRLRKALLFDALKRHEENICYRCGTEILAVEDLSVDHKKPWLHVSSALFWDIDNIAYSHLSCNSAAGTRSKELGNSGRKPIESPQGHSYCTVCKEHRPVAQFWKSFGVHSRNGLRDECKNCSRNRNTERVRKLRGAQKRSRQAGPAGPVWD